MSKLTWNDVKVGDVIEDQSRLRGLVLRVSNNGMKRILLTNGCIVSRFSNSPPPLQILGRFDELGCELNLERGGFTIPDEVLNGEQGKPAVEFETGLWFATRRGRKHLKCEYGAFYIDKRGNKLIRSDSELNQGCYLDCHHCEPDFFIFTEGELRDVKEQEYLRGLQDRKELREADGIDEGEDSAKPVSEMKEGDEITVKVKHIGKMKPTPLPDEAYEGMEGSAGEDYVGELIEYVNNVYTKLFKPNKFDMEKLETLATKARDQYERRQPPIPQEVRELVKCLDDRFGYISDDGVLRLQKTGQAYQILQECKRTLDRCEPHKPHPLTKVRELVGYAERYGHVDAATGEVHYGSVSDLRDAISEARRELQEYDGVVDSGQSGSEGGGK